MILRSTTQTSTKGAIEAAQWEANWELNEKIGKDSGKHIQLTCSANPRLMKALQCQYGCLASFMNPTIAP